VSDAKPEAELRNEILLCWSMGSRWKPEGTATATFRGQDLIVVSPGVPFDAPQLVQARNLGEPVIGEIELAAQFLAGSIVAITGANGKTTTTSLAGEILPPESFLRLWEEISARLRSVLWIRLGLRRGRCWKCRVFSWRRSSRFVRGLR